MITSPHNEKLKLIRKLGDRRHRDREGLFVAEGEDLIDAAASAGLEPEFVVVAGKDVDPALLDGVSTLGSGTRAIGVYRRRWAEPVGPVCADPHSPKAVRATMGSIFGQPIARADVEATPRPRVALSAHGGRPLGATGPPVTLCLGGEREGLPAEVLDRCDEEVTIPLRP